MADIRRHFGSGRSPFDAIMNVEDDGTEWWSARDMMEPMGYLHWESMEKVIIRARAACRNSGHDPSNHFRQAPKKVDIGSGARRSRSDVQMDRFGCYLLAMNGEPTKPEIAAAQRYFATMTRAAELSVPPPPQPVPRPWSERFQETVQPHLRFMYMNHLGCFTVISTSVAQMLSLEDELIRHMLRPMPSDRPDILRTVPIPRWAKSIFPLAITSAHL